MKQISMKAPKEQLPPSEGQFSPTTELPINSDEKLNVIQLRDLRKLQRQHFKIRVKERYNFIK